MPKKGRWKISSKIWSPRFRRSGSASDCDDQGW